MFEDLDTPTVHGNTLIVLGTWLLFYRALLRTRCRPVVERLTTCIAGLSLALLAPMLSWPPEGWRGITLGVIGVLLSCLHPALTALVVAVSLGLALGGAVWQLGICHLVPEVLGMSMHSTVLTLVSFVFIVVFTTVPNIAGPVSLIFFLVPALGGLMITLGLAILYPAAEGLKLSVLLGQAPCEAVAPGHPALRSVLCWAVFTAVGTGFQCLMAKLAAKHFEEAERDGNADLVAALLPEAGAQEGGGANLPRPNDGDNRFNVITKAIFAEEGADQSHLSDHERKLVEVCRKDSFERDRVLWGGGLI